MYARLMKKNLPIFGVPSKDLTGYLSTPKDAALGIS